MAKKTTRKKATSVADEAEQTTPQPPTKKQPRKKPAPPSPLPKKRPWSEMAKDSAERDITKRFSQDVRKIVDNAKIDLDKECLIFCFDPDLGISAFDLNRLFQAISRQNADQSKNVTLMICSPGGSIEPAFQISKLCKNYASETFRVIVPRQAKSAATLIALGADEIHMGPLSQLGPIDPQIGGLPALGIARALDRIAELSEDHPGSADMFAEYLHKALTVEQIGFCERISESAEQYAERLLGNKQDLPKKAALIAHTLVHDYKDHGFVIDIDEARKHFGDSLVVTDSIWTTLAESIYSLFETVNLYLSIHRQKRLLVLGDLADGAIIFDRRA